MPLFGFYIQKSSTYDANFKNQYYQVADNISLVNNNANQIIAFERAIFSQAVTFDVLHIWEVNANPRNFVDINLSGTGELAVTDANAPEICLQVNFNAATGFGGYKKYRTHWDNASLFGRLFQAATILAVNDAIAEFEQYLLATTTRGSVEFVSISPEGRQTFEQLSKKWYNRQPVSP